MNVREFIKQIIESDPNMEIAVDFFDEEGQEHRQYIQDIIIADGFHARKQTIIKLTK